MEKSSEISKQEQRKYKKKQFKFFKSFDLPVGEKWFITLLAIQQSSLLNHSLKKKKHIQQIEVLDREKNLLNK